MRKRSEPSEKAGSPGMGRIEDVAHKPNMEVVLDQSRQEGAASVDSDRNGAGHRECSQEPAALVGPDIDWEYAIELFINTYCTARGLASSTMKAYRALLVRFRRYVRFALNDIAPGHVRAKDVMQYLEYLRCDKNNGAAALNTQVFTLKGFFGALVAMEHLDDRQNPMVHFPKMKAPARKMPEVLTVDEMERFLEPPRVKTVLGIRNWAIITLLYSTGIRASECATLTEEHVDMQERTITVEGKGGHQRTIPFEKAVGEVLEQYRKVRGSVKLKETFFRSRRGGAMSRGAVYYSVRSTARKTGITKRVSPHRLRHTFATHLVKKGEDVRTIQVMLGHVWISSTQIYLHVTAQDLREAARRHPVEKLIGRVEELLPNVKIPFQEPRKSAFA